jgi:Transposase DDE domain
VLHDEPAAAPRRGRPFAVKAGGRVVATSSLVLWQVLTAAYARVGFEVLGDEAFRAMAMARIVEPTSKAGTVRVLAELGASCPSMRTLWRSLKRCNDNDYRDKVSKVCTAFSAAAGGLSALVMYDCTTLHFETEDEDALRKVGMSKEHRVDPQVQVGLLVDPSGFPLEVHLFEGDTAETTTILPVLQKFQERHGITGMVVVADAGMLSASNLNAIEDAGFSFIVGSRITKAPYDLAGHFTVTGTTSPTGRSSNPPGRWAPARTSASGEWPANGRSSEASATTRRSTRRSHVRRRSPKGRHRWPRPGS